MNWTPGKITDRARGRKTTRGYFYCTHCHKTSRLLTWYFAHTHNGHHYCTWEGRR